MAIENMQKERLKKLENIKAMGIDPYPASTKREHTAAQALDMFGQSVAVAGRIRSLRPHGKIQVLFSSQHLNKEQYEFLNNLDIGDFIAVQGEIIKTQAGQLTVSVKDYQLLTKSIRPLPSSWFGLKDVEERLRKRYLDLLLNPEARELFRLKSKFWANIRNYMLEKGFLEVEMPVLEGIPGGADARPFITHHNALNIDLYMRISLELPLKRLLVGGYEKVFEIGRIFRNEGIDDEHLQDYTQLEFYWAYADYNQLMDFVQNMYQTIIQETFGSLKLTWKGQEIDWSGNWPRVEYTDLLNEKREGLYILEELIEKQSAKIPGRPVFNSMIERIENDEACGILAWHPDRLARNSIDGGKIIYLVDTGKIKLLKFPQFWFDPTPQGKFMLTIAFGQSKYYVDSLSENTKRGLRQKALRGEFPSWAPVGYLNVIRKLPHYGYWYPGRDSNPQPDA